MIQIETDHFGSPSGRPTGLNRASRAIADAKERHQPRRTSATGQRFGIAAKLGKVGAGPRSIFEQARLPHPEIHDAAFADQVIINGLNEARMWLRMLKRIGGFDDFMGFGVDIKMPLCRP